MVSPSALAEGDLSERARQRAAELANDADLRLNPPKTLPVAPAESPGMGRILENSVGFSLIRSVLISLSCLETPAIILVLWLERTVSLLLDLGSGSGGDSLLSPGVLGTERADIQFGPRQRFAN